ncbi:ATP-binding cassette domain-containing protein [Spiroplasma floricola]|uniref:ABC transporter ATP-binding protein n=1 Tax=Spiroplasma floricola 23-6 TaxID=1336749 RepID=A0A2K8SEY1_9MOLU|nr:ATP-binding cassette domain-containing protein [Spiroplasma floricola]AUB31808.1 ABC transporter ATP-binding protein [Spiroplasma floricola 23-6]
MLIVKNVTKTYSKNTGNFDISLNVKENEVYGIMGPNGAGKSTLIRQILGFVKPDSGEITVKDFDSFKKTKEIMFFSGYIAGEIALYDGLTGIQYLKIVAKLKRNVDWNFVEKLLNFFELDAKKKNKKNVYRHETKNSYNLCYYAQTRIFSFRWTNKRFRFSNINSVLWSNIKI